jgi:hypothetical protein
MKDTIERLEFLYEPDRNGEKGFKSKVGPR